ncbi:alpha/beta hydrolase [Lactobacillus sp. CC-MHH1034]|uniref:alpha/beta fold hydrolase n=1 Tax=Agrilactobacillus fermenti TaxID=2586909 RepID=UPI001E64C858|nr:alpha/beta hydrolase [Agrilactobacillus fermenti]MCD2256157.1 alpha/beta hydrolase [Agrilactobacillus fermenti]
MKIKLNQVQINYEVSGQGQPLILLHGNGENLHLFDTITPALAVNFQVYRLDTRGHGQSDPVSVFHYQDMAADVVAFIQKMQLDRPILYGFSDGGIVGLLIASQFPDLLSRLIVSGANTQPFQLSPFFRALYWLKNQVRPDPKLDLMFNEPHITENELKKITVPTLVLAGQHDLIPQRETEKVAQAIIHSQLKIIPQANHSNYVARGLTLIPLINDFSYPKQ